MHERLAPTSLGGWWALGLVLTLALPARAQQPDESLDALVDRVVGTQLTAYRIPGATVAVVLNGQPWLVKGYGSADEARHRPVVAERTLFRVASVGKLWVWTAVMQLVEQGRLDLDTDLGTYLEDVPLPATFPRPITLSHLMAHAPGFEVPERLWPTGPVPASLPDYLRQHMPARVRPPGELSAYSDYGTSLAEHVVERVSGQPFEQYLREHVLEPLGMKRSVFGRAVPLELAADVARGHTLEDGQTRAQPLEQVVVASSGSLLTTAPDVVRFMLAHLRRGQLEGQRILSEETVERMHRRHFTHDPRLSGWAHGFMEFRLNGRRLLGHTGDAYLFHSLLVLLPERGFGLFVSYNGPGERNAAQRARMELLRAVLDHEFPAPGPRVPEPPEDFTSRAGRFEGGYQTTWRAYTTAESSLGWRQEVRVRDGGDGTLLIREPGGIPRRWVELEPLFFRPTDDAASPERVAFREDAQGHITHLFFENRPTEAYERVPLYETSGFTLGLLAVCAVLFSWAVVGGMRDRRPSARGLAVVGLLDLLCLASITLLLLHPPGPEAGERPWLLEASRACGLLAIVLTAGALPWSVWVEREPSRHGAVRARLAATSLAALAFALWLHHWHWLG